MIRRVRWRRGWTTGIVLAWAGTAAAAGPELLGTYCRTDQPFPEFTRFWSEGAPSEDGPANPDVQAAPRSVSPGCSLHVFVRNAESQPLRIDDVLLQGISLKKAIAFSEQRKNRKPASIFFARLSDAERRTLIAAGEPVWYRVDPQPLAPGQIGEVTVRLRGVPKAADVRMELEHTDRTVPVTVAVQSGSPRLEGVSFSPDLREVFVYLTHPKTRGQAPARILFDGQDVTRSARIGVDARIDVVPVVIRLAKAPPAGSFHCLEATYPDGTAAWAGIRAWHDELVYGVWGGRPGDESDTDLARAYIRELREHNVNMQMPQVGSKALAAFYKSEAGQRYCNESGVRFVIGDLGKWGIKSPYALFIHDEPDAGDAHITGLPGGHEVGSLAEWAIDRGLAWREQYPATPQTLNVDLTYKPHNYFVYGQVPDILMADPYYQPRLRTAYWQHPERVPLYRTAAFVHVISAVVRSAAAPKPTHIILYANRYIDKPNNREFRYPTPDEKRIEVFYALAGGAKGISYWWFTPGKPACGLGGVGPEAEKLWREIGLLGAELRTAGPIIVRSCPAAVPVKAPAGVMVRELLAGLDTMVLIVVNEQHVNDERGTTITAIQDAEITVELPAWLQTADAFEIRTGGIGRVTTRKNGSQVTFELGTLTRPRMIVLTANGSLRGQCEGTYRSRFAVNVARLLRPAKPPAR